MPDSVEDPFDVSSSLKRLTPAHISLSAWLPQNKPGKWQAAAVKQPKSSETKGSYCVATKSIKQGDVIINEEPFIRQLDLKFKRHHCSHCFKKIQSKKISCRVKSCQWGIAYCSRQCETEGWSRSHQWFCRFPELIDMDQDALFALIGYITSRSTNDNIIPGLVSNIQLLDSFQIEEYTSKIKPIASLFNFSESIFDSLVEILAQIRCNTFTIKQAESVAVDSSFVVSRESLKLGRAIYLSASKLNHECDPNALVTFGANDNPCQLQLYCVKGPVCKDQEVTISYGPLAAKHTLQERQMRLKSEYFFTCQCASCVESTDLPYKIYKCQICKTGRLYRQQTKCENCGERPHWPFFIKAEAEAGHKTSQNEYHVVLQLQESIYHSDTLPIGKTLDRLAQTYCMQGQWKQAAEYSKRSLEVTKSIYGKISVETAEEMMKLSTITLNLGRKQEALKQINATLVLYKILGLDKTAPEDIEELQDQKNYLMFIVR